MRQTKRLGVTTRAKTSENFVRRAGMRYRPRPRAPLSNFSGGKTDNIGMDEGGTSDHTGRRRKAAEKEPSPYFVERIEELKAWLVEGSRAECREGARTQGSQTRKCPWPEQAISAAVRAAARVHSIRGVGTQ